MRPHIVYLLAVVVAIIVVTQAVPTSHQDSGNNNERSPNISHHMIVGNHVPGDYVAMRLTFSGGPSRLETFETERTLSISNRITMVKALDQNTDGNGGFATLVRGGVGDYTVTVHFRSQKGHSINFVIELYAKG